MYRTLPFDITGEAMCRDRWDGAEQIEFFRYMVERVSLATNTGNLQRILAVRKLLWSKIGKKRIFSKCLLTKISFWCII